MKNLKSFCLTLVLTFTLSGFAVGQTAHGQTDMPPAPVTTVTGQTDMPPGQTDMPPAEDNTAETDPLMEIAASIIWGIVSII